MNEFIVWDEVEKEFWIVDTLVMTYGGMRVANVTPLPENSSYETYTIHEWEYRHSDKIFPYIGKTDINNKKIYADCSIVEFIINYKDGCKPEKLNGFFTYNKKTCSYDISCPWEQRLAANWFWIDRVSDFKIIDTIQENKLGLIKCTQ